MRLPRVLAAGGPGLAPSILPVAAPSPIPSRGAPATNTHANRPSRDQNASHRGRCWRRPCPAAAGGSSSRPGGQAGTPRGSVCGEWEEMGQWQQGQAETDSRAPEPPRPRAEHRKRKKRRRRRAVSDGAQRQQQRGLREALLLPAAITVTRPLHILI